jgi:hypothetical protein
LQNKLNRKLMISRKYIFVFSALLFFKTVNAQIANYISNGSFEQLNPCTQIALYVAKYWRPIDSAAFSNVRLYSTCYPNVPSGGLTYQYPRTGNSFGLGTLLCQPPYCSVNSNRGYFRNRLKSNLIAGKTYCVKFYVNVSDASTYGISSIGAFFGDNNLDTITKCNIPLTYITPQIENSVTNIITDTLGWSLITGTFVATGIEKHCVIGNFKSDLNTNKSFINPTNLPTIGCDILLDDVSCIPTDLPAYAGADIWSIPNNTVYIGRQRDVGIDEACTWYNMTNTLTPIANAAGLTLTVALGTQTYMVKQDICGIIKYDTVVVFASALGNAELGLLNDKLQLYPNPANDFVLLAVGVTELTTEYKSIHIYNQLGQLIREEELSFKNNETKLSTSELPNGTYLVSISTTKGYHIKKNLIISR